MVARDHHGHHHPNGHTAHDQPQSAKATATHTDHHASHETAMGHGGLCRNCARCQYPVCSFGKG